MATLIDQESQTIHLSQIIGRGFVERMARCLAHSIFSSYMRSPGLSGRGAGSPGRVDART